MQEIIVHYKSPEGVLGSVPVLLGETYVTAEDFVEDFLADHVGYTVVEIGETA